MDSLDQAAIAAMAEAAPLNVGVPEMVPGRVNHIDGDYLAYTASGNDDTTAGEARAKANDAIFRFIKATGSESALVHLTSSGSTKGGRYHAATVKAYQAQRTGHHPKNWLVVREHLESLPEAILWRDREADDGLGLASTTKDAVITTKDKDMRMLPGIHSDWSTPSIMTVVPQGAYDVQGPEGLQFGTKWFYLQMLQGDPADNIPGLEKIIGPKGTPTAIGPVGAAKLLEQATTAEDACLLVYEAYEGFYKDAWADRFVEQASLLWIRRDRKADLMDFLRYTPTRDLAKILYTATHDLNVRVGEAIREIETFGSEGNP